MLNIGLVGLGFIGKTHLEAYKKLENVNVLQICTRSNRSDELQDFRGEITSDYDELLNNPAIDVVDICVPTYLHEEYIVKAAEAGKQIICEKPLALNVEATNRIIKAVKEAKVQLFVGHVLRFWPAYMKIKETSKQASFGIPQVMHAKRLGQVPTWSEWFKHPEKSGGALFDLHIHDIDFAYYLLGEVESVYAVGNQNEYGAWNHILTTLRFKNQVVAVVEASHKMPSGYPFTMSLRLQSSDAAIDFQLKAGENIEAINESEVILYEGQDSTHLVVEEKDAFQNELAYFINCIDKNHENEVIPLEEVLYVIKLLEAIETSLRTGEIQLLD